MRVELSRLLREWKRNYRDSLLMTVLHAQSDNALEATAAAVAEANAALRALRTDKGTDFACTEPWPGPRGPAFMAYICDSAEALDTWTSAFAAAATRAGLTGTLDAERSDKPEFFAQSPVLLTAALAVTGWAPAQQGWTSPGWAFDAELRDRIARASVEWVANGASEVSVGIGFTMFPCPVAEVPALISRPGALETADSRATAPAVVISPGPDLIRYVKFSQNGHVLIKHRDSGLTWEESLADLTRPMLELADVCDFGIVRWARGGEVRIDGIVSGYPPPRLPDDGRRESPLDYYQKARYLDSRFLPDAHGVQVIGDGHLSMTRDLSGWDVVDLGGGKHLVTSRELAGWYATNTPSMDLVQSARHDFGDAILRGCPPPQANP